MKFERCRIRRIVKAYPKFFRHQIYMIVILHNIRSLHNVGSIFRTADAAGVEKIYLAGITPTPVDRFGKIRPQLTKVSLGAEKTVSWEKVELRAKPRTVPQSGSGARVKSITSLLVRLKQEGYQIIAIEQDKKSIPYHRYEKSRKEETVLLIGNEVSGIPKKILKRCDKILEIPMRGRKESLNVSVAFGIVLFHLVYA